MAPPTERRRNLASMILPTITHPAANKKPKVYRTITDTKMSDSPLGEPEPLKSVEPLASLQPEESQEAVPPHSLPVEPNAKG